MNNDKKRNLFNDFLSYSQVLIVDKSTSSRRRLLKTLVNLGGKRHLIHSVSHMSEAKEIIGQFLPQLIISDYKINGGSGFELFQYVREKFPQDKKMSLVLVTSNISQSAVARAAEEDVDTFIVKPYTVQILEKSLINSVISKLYPSAYHQKIFEGKELIEKEKYEKALTVFSEAVKMNPKPSLAYYYHGLVFKKLEEKNKAKKDFYDGLKVNDIHFKCQVGLFDLFMEDKNYNVAYSIVKRISKYFPANPSRINQIVKLAVVTKNFVDIEEYYEHFIELEERSEETIKYICAGLFVASKYYLKIGIPEKTVEIIDKIAVSCQGNATFLKSIILLCYEMNRTDVAKKHLTRFSGKDLSSDDYRICQYVAHNDTMDRVDIVNDGMDIFQSDARNLLCFKILVDNLILGGFNKRAQKVLSDAKTFWPEVNFNLSQDVAS